MTLRNLLRHPATLVITVIAAFAIGLALGGGDDATTTGHDHDHAPATETDAGPQVYTCSMHPSVRLEDPDAKCPICFMDLIPVTNDGGGPGAERRLALDASAVAAAQIRTTSGRALLPRGRGPPVRQAHRRRDPRRAPDRVRPRPHRAPVRELRGRAR